MTWRQTLRALGCEPALVEGLTHEVLKWEPVGMLDRDDFWALATALAWRLRQRNPWCGTSYVWICARWELAHAHTAERLRRGRVGHARWAA